MKRATAVSIFVIFFHTSFAQEKVIPLYEKSVPNSKAAPAGYVEETDSSGLISNVTEPAITLYLPEKGTATGTAVIICPGGGYAVLASEAKSGALARAFNKTGVAAFVLKYRLPSDDIMIDKTIGPLQDLQTAILIVRKRAAEWGIDPGKVGVVGLSAGGHLASTAGTHLNMPVIGNKEHINLRPDFMMLVYPVIIFDPQIPSRVRENLVGKKAPSALLNRFSNEKHVTANTPPTFLVHAADDDLVPVKNTLLFFNALMKHKVKAAMHIIQSGGHGFGLDAPAAESSWFHWGRNWMRENGF